MKSTRLVKLLSFIYYYTLISCSDGDSRNHEKRKEVKHPEESNETMSFSFNIKNFNDFKCNFDDMYISDILQKVPPFYGDKNIRNFVGLFGLIFQYSLIKNNEEFRKVIENFYNFYIKKVSEIKEDESINVSDPKNFENYLENLFLTIKHMLNKEAYDMVKIKKQDGRLVIFYDSYSSAELFNFNLFQILPTNITVKDQGNKKIVESMTEFYLRNLLKPGFIESFNGIFKSKNKVMKKKPIKETKPDDDPSKFLQNSYSRLCQLVNNESIDECKGNPVEKRSIYSIKAQKYFDLIEKLYVSGELPQYLKELIPKAKAKFAYETSDISIELSRFLNNSTEYNTNVHTFSILLEKALKDPTIISYGENPLDREAFESLVLRCLELAF